MSAPRTDAIALGLASPAGRSVNMQPAKGAGVPPHNRPASCEAKWRKSNGGANEPSITRLGRPPSGRLGGVPPVHATWSEMSIHQSLVPGLSLPKGPRIRVSQAQQHQVTGREGIGKDCRDLCEENEQRARSHLKNRGRSLHLHPERRSGQPVKTPAYPMSDWPRDYGRTKSIQ